MMQEKENTFVEEDPSSSPSPAPPFFSRPLLLDTVFFVCVVIVCLFPFHYSIKAFDEYPNDVDELESLISDEKAKVCWLDTE